MTTNPFVSPRTWDTAQIAGETTPGLCQIVGLKRPRKWDAEKGYGISGGGLKFTGEDVPKFTLQIRLYNATQVDDYNARIAPLVEAVPDKKNAKALEFSHPGAPSISSIVIEEPGALERVDETGIWGVNISCAKYTKPKPGLGKPAAAKTKPKEAPPAQDEADKEIEILTKQMKELAA